MQYVHNAQQIANLTKDRISKYVNKIANQSRYKTFVKSSLYSIWNSPICYAQKVYENCLLANKKRLPDERLALLDNACRNLDLLEAAMQTFYDKFKLVVKDKFIELLTEKIDCQRRLLEGCKEWARNAS